MNTGMNNVFFFSLVSHVGEKPWLPIQRKKEESERLRREAGQVGISKETNE